MNKEVKEMQQAVDQSVELLKKAYAKRPKPKKDNTDLRVLTFMACCLYGFGIYNLIAGDLRTSATFLAVLGGIIVTFMCIGLYFDNKTKV
jgi:hypothetical protein